ncbi:MAG: neutral/alkaline non-lysosomal ceramidase N-terminal domain-containing protein [Dysgonamonadaceae bacterium]|nr:neutral/alkaline non-lysosomal ceramidase N-terminal domain-containing protein [Dysgonamonadaceae bacterium]
MKQKHSLLVFLVLLTFSFLIRCEKKDIQEKPIPPSNQSDEWKVGVARHIITPREFIWMAGYASRISPSDGKLHDLWAKAITFEDAQGVRSVLITTDLLSIPKDFSETIKSKVKEKHGLEKSQIILSCSHTHTGPVIARALEYIYPMNSDDWRKVEKYTKELEVILLQLVDESMKELIPAKIYTQNGIARFQVNRRNNKESEIGNIVEFKGPNDYAVPVIKVEGLDKSLIAIIFGYACHPTTLSINKFSGDYPGFAQIELEKLYPGTMAMFFQGAGADQNPLPRRTIPLAMQYGNHLASSVESVLSQKMIKQDSKLIAKYIEIDLPFDDPLSLEELRIISTRNDYHGRWAQGMIDDYHRDGYFIKSYPYPISYWELGNQKLFVLGGESVIFYSIKLKEIFGEQVFVMSYANDVMGYIPSKLILKEGGYEGDTSQRVYGLPAKWDMTIESLIINEISKLALDK